MAGGGPSSETRSQGRPVDPVVDSLNMRGATEGLGDQIRRAEESARAADLDGVLGGVGRYSWVVVSAMGDSATGGDLVAAVLADQLDVPVIVNRNIEMPAFVGPGTLVVAVSYSGRSSETVAAAEVAVERGATVVVVTAGGDLAALAAARGLLHLPVDAAVAEARSAIAALSIPVLVLLERIGLVGDQRPAVAEAASAVDRRLDMLARSGDAARLARRIGRTFPILYGAGALGAVVANRWKTQFNQNPKVPAFANTVPELTHNEVCGWAQHGDITRQTMTMILLRHGFEHPADRRRFELVREVCDEVVASIHEVESEGNGALAQAFDLVTVGDMVSLELSFQSAVDPGPVPVLDEFKNGLSQSAG